MREVLIRRATTADAPVAARIIAAALAEHDIPFEPEGRDADVAMFGARSDHDDLVAATREGRVVGVVSVGPHGDPGVAWVSKLFVDRDARGTGTGRALLHAAHDAARARGMHTVGLRTRPIFLAAVQLYVSEGYRASGPPAPGSMVVVLHRPL